MQAATIELKSLRLDPRDDGDLLWFYDYAEGELGLHGQTYERSPRATADDEGDALHPSMTKRAIAAERYGRISRTIDRMAEQHRTVLRKWCSERERKKCRRALVDVFGDRLAVLAALVARRRAMTVDDLETACNASKHAKGDARAAGAAVVASVRRSAEAMLVAAVEDWNQARPVRRTRAAA